LSQLAPGAATRLSPKRPLGFRAAARYNGGNRIPRNRLESSTMPPFRRVEDRRAGPTALGILVPPGLRTFVILRPRALEWDLLPLRPGDGGAAAGFCEFGRDEAAGVARRVQRALEQGAGAGANPVEAVALPDGAGYWVVARAGEFCWVACRRVPGQPYRASLFATAEGAGEAAARLACVLCPGADAGQEYYFNTQHYSRR
jgi:hypothetical protein